MKVRRKSKDIKIVGGEETAPPEDNLYIDSGAIREFHIPHATPTMGAMVEELRDMADVLLGRTKPPINEGVSTLLEIADAYFGRASEMTMMIQQFEREGKVSRGDQLYKFRTGELRTFMDMAKRAAETGSRRLTAAQLRYDATRRGLETEGDETEVDWEDR